MVKRGVQHCCGLVLVMSLNLRLQGSDYGKWMGKSIAKIMGSLS